MQNNIVNKKVILPKHFNISSVPSVLKEIEGIFSITGKKIPGFILDTSKVEDLSMIGALLLYKIVEFTVIYECFVSATIAFHPNYKVMQFLAQYGFHDLITAFVYDKENKISKELKKLKISVNDKFIIAPKALLRDDPNSREEINKLYLPQIQTYYKNDPKAISMILLVFSEILLNFWEHAQRDSQSIIVANGNKNNIQISCADTGEGIVSTLGSKYPNKRENAQFILGKSIEKGNTSKSGTNHMGYGLWILDEITTAVKGQMYIYSQGAYYSNESGKKKTGNCGYWQGTIIYLSLPLFHSKTLEDI
ncbi:ATP-binding protein [Pedobacter lithocola]|uniref:ATP-binding protein n=1 Tax=Pedobacter lithocola TaxID=1908239 RepID=A0ABV8P620_9SPHI